MSVSPWECLPEKITSKALATDTESMSFTWSVLGIATREKFVIKGFGYNGAGFIMTLLDIL